MLIHSFENRSFARLFIRWFRTNERTNETNDRTISANVDIHQLKAVTPLSCRLLTALLGNGSQKSLPSNPLLGKPRPAGRPAGGRSSRTVVGGARVVSGAEKKAFDRGGPVWPPRSNAADDRLGGRHPPGRTPRPPLPALFVFLVWSSLAFDRCGPIIGRID